MTKVDQFESVFKAADKPRYQFHPYTCEEILLVSDLEASQASEFLEQAKQFHKEATGVDGKWHHVCGIGFKDLQRLLAEIDKIKPDLICTYRNLGSDAWKWPFSLGEPLDVMTQVVACPVLVLPHPQATDSQWYATRALRVMAVTDHLTGDDRLVNYAVGFSSQADSEVILSHIEDKVIFDRYIEYISKIPAIDTEEAKEELQIRVLKEPRDYIDSCKKELVASGIATRIEAIVTVGRRVEDYKRIVREKDIGLLILNTKDHGQMAMHGMAYPLAVELRNIPMLML